jgi:hypothetical protein
VPLVVDRDADQQRADQGAERDSEALEADVARALFRVPEAGDEVLKSNVEKDQRNADDQRRGIEHRESGKEIGNEESHGEPGGSQHDGTKTPHAVGNLPGLHREHERAETVERNEHADGGGRCAELDGVERHQDAAAHEAHPVEQAEK